MGEPEWCLHGSAFKMPLQTSYAPTSQLAYSSRCNSGTISTNNGSPCKKSVVENTYMRRLNTNLSSSNLLNLHHVISNRFCGNNTTKKSVSLLNNNSKPTATKELASHRNKIVQLGTVKSDNNAVNLHDYTTGSSSSSSGNSSGVDYKRRHRCTLPSITTTISMFLFLKFLWN